MAVIRWLQHNPFWNEQVAELRLRGMFLVCLFAEVDVEGTGSHLQGEANLRYHPCIIAGALWAL